MRSKGVALDDLNLQFPDSVVQRSIQILPTLIFNGRGLFCHVTGAILKLSKSAICYVAEKYALWSVGNGLAISCYNLARPFYSPKSAPSTAALNCTRRILGTVCTSLLFLILICLKTRPGSPTLCRKHFPCQGQICRERNDQRRLETGAVSGT